MSGIYEKLRRVLKGRVLAMLDRMESPQQSLRVTVDEMEEVVRQAKEAAASYGATLRKSEKEQEQCKRLRDEWEHRAEASLVRGDEASARHALRERIRLEARIAELAPRIDSASETYRALKDEMRVLQARLDDAKLQRASLESRQQAATAQRDFARLASQGRAGSTDGAFGAMEAHVFQVEAEAEIEHEIAGELGKEQAAIEKHVVESQIDAELAALRKRIGPEPARG
jgi:phage shock protein A